MAQILLVTEIFIFEVSSGEDVSYSKTSDTDDTFMSSEVSIV